MSVPHQEQRADGFTDALDALSEILARFPGESVRVSPVWASPRRGHLEPWRRVTVQVPRVFAFAPRFVAFDDATSFRLRAVEMTTSMEG